ncbi:MAG: NADPH:quinone oxidoreductase family protein [Alphaproteobacteria bacterium]
MRAALCKEFGTPPKLKVDNIDVPTLGKGEVRIEVHACGINFADVLIVQGKYQTKPPLPFVPGGEVAGVVLEIAPDVTNVELGQRVLGMSSQGGFAEEVVVDAQRVLGIPDVMDFKAGASFAVTYGTSHLALDHRAHLTSGETLLVLGASGGVGLTAVEIGKAMGATVIGAASTGEKLKIVQDHGADHLINYVEDDLRKCVKEIVGGIDVVYDPVGGEPFLQALRCMNWEGRIIVIGFASGTIQKIPANYLLLKNCAAVGAYWGPYMDKKPEVLLRSLSTLIDWFEAGRLAPHISASYPLAKADAALALLYERKATGKVVLTTRD